MLGSTRAGNGKLSRLVYQLMLIGKTVDARELARKLPREPLCSRGSIGASGHRTEQNYSRAIELSDAPRLLICMHS